MLDGTAGSKSARNPVLQLQGYLGFAKTKHPITPVKCVHPALHPFHHVIDSGDVYVCWSVFPTRMSPVSKVFIAKRIERTC